MVFLCFYLQEYQVLDNQNVSLMADCQYLTRVQTVQHAQRSVVDKPVTSQHHLSHLKIINCILYTVKQYERILSAILSNYTKYFVHISLAQLPNLSTKRVHPQDNIKLVLHAVQNNIYTCMIWISSEFISNCITRPPVKKINLFSRQWSSKLCAHYSQVVE